MLQQKRRFPSPFVRWRTLQIELLSLSYAMCGTELIALEPGAITSYIRRRFMHQYGAVAQVFDAPLML